MFSTESVDGVDALLPRRFCHLIQTIEEHREIIALDPVAGGNPSRVTVIAHLVRQPEIERLTLRRPGRQLKNHGNPRGRIVVSGLQQSIKQIACGRRLPTARCAEDQQRFAALLENVKDRSFRRQRVRRAVFDLYQSVEGPRYRIGLVAELQQNRGLSIKRLVTDAPYPVISDSVQSVGAVFVVTPPDDEETPTPYAFALVGRVAE